MYLFARDIDFAFFYDHFQSEVCRTRINEWQIFYNSLSKESFNIDGQQFHQYQQNKQSPLT